MDRIISILRNGLLDNYVLQRVLTHGVVSGRAKEEIYQNREESHVYTDNRRNIAQNRVCHTYAEINIDLRYIGI